MDEQCCDEYLPGWEPYLNEFKSSRHIESLETILPGGIGDDFHRGKEYVGSSKLKDRVAIITGGDSGIGRSIAILYAMEGADIVLNYLPIEQEDALLAQKVLEEKGAKVHLVPGDLCDAKVCKEIIDSAIKRFGHFEILVNVAGMQKVHDKFEDYLEEDMQKVMTVNLRAPMILCKYAIPHLKRGASIINMASINGFSALAPLVDYSASKAGMIGFTRALAKNLAPRGIRVNAIAPGAISTPLLQSTTPATGKAGMWKGPPLQRVGQPIEVATAAVYLASAESSYVSASAMAITGGDPILS